MFNLNTVDLKTLDLTHVPTVLREAKASAVEAAEEMYGRVGERDMCGFAWVTVYGVRSNSRLGKVLAANGFSKAYGGGLQLWDPAGLNTQSISVKEAGATAYANVLSVELGLRAYASSRLD
jgi:hypothetical protein